MIFNIWVIIIIQHNQKKNCDLLQNILISSCSLYNLVQFYSITNIIVHLSLDFFPLFFSYNYLNTYEILSIGNVHHLTKILFGTTFLGEAQTWGMYVTEESNEPIYQVAYIHRKGLTLGFYML